MTEPLRADHILRFTGVDHGIPMFELECVHGAEDKFFKDDEGREYDDCLIQGWWDNDGLDLVNSDHSTPNGVLLFTTWNWGNEPALVGAAEYEEWKEGQDD